MKKAVFLTVFVMVLSFSGLSAPSIDVEKTSDGSELTLDVDGEDVGGLRINQIPSTWKVENKKKAGSIFTSDPSEGYAAWAWASDKSAVDISITFAKEDSGEESLKLTAENSGGEQVVEDVLVGTNDEEPGNPENDPPTSEKGLILEEDFENGLGGWESVSGKEGEIVTKDGRKALTMEENSADKDSIMEYDFGREIKPEKIELSVYQDGLCNGYCQKNQIDIFDAQGDKKKNRKLTLFGFKHWTLNHPEVKTSVDVPKTESITFNPFRDGWANLQVRFDWENDKIDEVLVNGEKAVDNLKFRGDITGVSKLQINRGYYASEDIWVDSVKVYTDGEDSVDPVDPSNPEEPKQSSISFEDGAFSSISSNGPLKILEGEAKTSGKNGYEVSQKYSTEGQNSLHLASYGSLDPIKVGFKADLTNVEKLVYDGYPEANNAINGDIYLYAGSNQISNDLVFYPMGEPAPEEDVWHEDIEEDVSSIQGEKMVSFRVRGSGNDAYFDNIRFLNSEGERIAPEEVLVSDSQMPPPENPVDDPDDGNRTVCVGQCNPQGDLISDKEAESALNTLNQIETRLKEVEENVDLMVDYYSGEDSEKAKAWTEIQIKISAAQRKIETTRSKLQNAKEGKEISSSEIKEDLDSIQTGIKTATDLILEA